MGFKNLRPILLLLFMLSLTGCHATRKVGQAVVAIPLFVAEGLISGIFNSDETPIERARREQREQELKRFWGENPEKRPPMHEAFMDY